MELDATLRDGTGYCVGSQGKEVLTYEQVEHDVSDDDIEGAKVNEGASIVAAVRFPVAMFVRSAEWRLHLGNEADKQT